MCERNNYEPSSNMVRNFSKLNKRWEMLWHIHLIYRLQLTPCCAFLLEGTGDGNLLFGSDLVPGKVNLVLYQLKCVAK